MSAEIPRQLPIPHDRAEVTAGWLSQVLAQAGIGVQVEALEIDDSLLPGMMSDIFRVIPAYAADTTLSGRIPDAPPSLIVKLSATHEQMRMREPTRAGYRKEVRFYQHLAGRLRMPVPRCFFSAVDFETGFHVLVLEDLAPAVRRPMVDGCREAEAKRAVTELARFHGEWWDNAALEKLDWLPEPAVLDPDAVRAQHRLWWPAFVAAAGERLPAAMLAYGETLADCFATLMNELLFSTPRTLRHGDYSLSNMLFADPDGTAPTASGAKPFVVIDWQMLARGKGPWDLAWFLGQSLTIEQRRAWESALLEIYHGGLIESGVRNYAFDRCLEDYRRAIGQRFGTLISSVVALPFTAAQKAEILDVQLPRNVAAITDHGALSILHGS